MSNIVVGDLVVFHQTFEPHMTVESINEREACCIWISKDGAPHRFTFPLQFVSRYDAPKQKPRVPVP